jgi:predicted O-linked N-acetylglucosamine transferase (SPINDLY family)
MNQRAQVSASPARNDRCACGSGRKFKHCCLRAAHAQTVASAAVPGIRVPTGDLLKQALAHHEAGRLKEAQELYRTILHDDPENVDALHYSGLALHQAGETALAIAQMSRAAEQTLTYAHYALNFGQVLEAGGELERAIVCYRQVVSQDRSSAAGHLKLGLALVKSGQPQPALALLSEAQRLNPESHEAANGLGNALQQLGYLEQAVVCYRKAVAVGPSSIEARNNLGIVLADLGRYEEAIAAYQEALTHKPDFAPLYSNLADALYATGELEAAIACCQRAIALQPNYPGALLNLANAYKKGGQLREAVEQYRNVLALDPTHARAHTNLATTLVNQDRIEEAIASYREAIRSGSNDNTACTNLLYLYSFTCHVTPEEELTLAQQWEKHALSDAQRMAARQRASAASGSFPVKPRTARKLRIGIVSAELGSHSVAVFLQPFLEHLDHDRFHLTLFPTVGHYDSRSRLFREMADSFLPLIGVPDEAAAERIRAQEIDILIDTTGHTSNCRLGIFAHRAAPVQCSWIGYWSTTGLTEMDWYITDHHYAHGCDSHFCEGLWKLPHVAHCYKGDESLPVSAWEPDPDGTIWLGSFNRYEKIRRETLRLWSKVLHAVPNAQLALVDHAGQESENHERILASLDDCGVDADRVVFLPRVPGRDFAQYMALYDRLDIALDTIPFNSGTTAFDALWMGVPLVALEGNRICGRMAASIVRNLGRPEWAATSEDEYVSIVCSLARDVEGRKKLRNTLRTSMLATPLCDGQGLARALEDAFEAMYDRWQISG